MCVDVTLVLVWLYPGARMHGACMLLICTCACMYVCAMYLCMHVCMCACVYAYKHVCVCLQSHVHLCHRIGVHFDRYDTLADIARNVRKEPDLTPLDLFKVRVDELKDTLREGKRTLRAIMSDVG